LKVVKIVPLSKRPSGRKLKMCGQLGLIVYTYVELEVRIAVEVVHGLIHSEVFYRDEPDEWDKKIDRAAIISFINKVREDEDS